MLRSRRPARAERADASESINLSHCLGLPRQRDFGTAGSVKRKQRQRNRSAPTKSEVPANVQQYVPRKARTCLSKQWLDQVAAGTEKGIRDTYAWKDAVQRLGLKEARRRLRLGLLTTRCPDANPLN